MIKFLTQGWDYVSSKKMQDEDPNKNIEGKGTLQRFLESNFKELDDYAVDKLDTLNSNVLDITTCDDKYIKHFESLFGITVFPSYLNLNIRRKVASRAVFYYQKKGTKLGFTSLFNLIDCTVVFSEFFNFNSFDSPYTFDDTERVFDMSKCFGCSSYSLEITSNSPITPTDLYRGSYSIIKFNHPIGATLKSALIDGIELTTAMMNYFISNGGNSSTILGTDGYYNFTQNGNIIPSDKKRANLKVTLGVLYLNL